MQDVAEVTTVVLPAHAAEMAIAHYEGKLRTRVLEISEPFQPQTECRCPVCKAVRRHCRRRERKGYSFGTWPSEPHGGEPGIILDLPHGRSAAWMVQLTCQFDPTLKVKGKVPTGKQLQQQIGDVRAAADFWYRMRDMEDGVERESEGSPSPAIRPVLAIDVAEVIAAFKVCLPAVSTDQVRQNLAGVCIRLAPGTLRFLSTDGHKATFCHLVAPDDMPEADTIVPREWCEFLVKDKPLGIATLAMVTLDDDPENPSERLALVAPSGEISPAVEGRFPDMDSILPKLAECSWHTTVPFDELQARLSALGGLISDRKVKPVKFQCNDGVVRVETENDGHGRAVTCFASMATEGEFTPFGINAAYLQAMLKPYVADSVTISGSSPLHPLRLTIPGLEHIAMVVMPLRIEW